MRTAGAAEAAARLMADSDWLPELFRMKPADPPAA
jgi:hypothetical protein